jgi:hypothetical protein
MILICKERIRIKDYFFLSKKTKKLSIDAYLEKKKCSNQNDDYPVGGKGKCTPAATGAPLK